MRKEAVFLSLLLLVLANHGGPKHVGYEILPALSQATAPKPTEQGMDADVEERGHSARDAWIERMHKTAPGVDWRAIELANAEREMQRRGGLPHSALTANPWREVGSAN